MEIFKPATSEDLRDAIRDGGQKLEIVGAGTKRGYGRPVRARANLDMSALSGIVSYEPEELVVTVKAGTPLAELEAELATRRQRLAFEPADWGRLLGAGPGRATIGGIVAANVAGPRRVSHGAARDHVLGLSCVSGRGESFVCGGKVVKNVTGFDLPKLLTGSLGTLAIIDQVTLRVAPWPDAVRTIILHGLDDTRAIAAMNAGLGSPYEVSGAAHLDGTTALRLEGPAVSVLARAEALSRDLAPFGTPGMLGQEESERLWQIVRDIHPFIGDFRLVWRLMVPPSGAAEAVAAIAAAHPLEAIYDRGGALVWLAMTDPAEALVRQAAEAAGGRATLFRAPAELREAIPPFHPEPPALARLSARIRAAFDPRCILNPGRMRA